LVRIGVSESSNGEWVTLESGRIGVTNIGNKLEGYMRVTVQVVVVVN